MEGFQTARTAIAVGAATTYAYEPIDEIVRWEGLGVPVLPGPQGQKGPRQVGWAKIPHEETWRLARIAADGATNLCIRTGLTNDGTRHLAAIDLDGKCPCGHDQSVHGDGAGTCLHEGSAIHCTCDRYDGMPAAKALAVLCAVLPPGVAITRTGRGYHILFWAKKPVSNGKIERFSADLFGGALPAALQIPPSRHPSGRLYTWVEEPGEDLPVVDLEAVGLIPDSLRGRERQVQVTSANRAPVVASAAAQREFRGLMAQLGLQPGTASREKVLCPWHADEEPSLSVEWSAAVFHCFGCGEAGSLRRLRELSGPASPPSYDPSDDLLPLRGRGSQLGGADAIAERDRLVAGLKEIDETPRAVRMQECRSLAWDDPGALETLSCPTGDATPVRRRTNSCDDPQCPTCMPWRFRSDWKGHWTNRATPPDLTVAVLEARDASDGLSDTGYTRRVRAWFREWRRAREIGAGFYALLLLREGDRWQARLIIAIPTSDASRLSPGRTFDCHITAGGIDVEAVGQLWQQAYLTEACQWQTIDELRAFRRLTAGRRKFQGWGDYFGDATPESPEDEPPVHRISGGGGRTQGKQTCPRCGSALERRGPFDPEQMELISAADGLVEWRWRGGPHGNRHRVPLEGERS